MPLEFKTIPTVATTGCGGCSVMELNFSCITADMVAGVRHAGDMRM